MPCGSADLLIVDPVLVVEVAALELDGAVIVSVAVFDAITIMLTSWVDVGMPIVGGKASIGVVIVVSVAVAIAEDVKETGDVGAPDAVVAAVPIIVAVMVRAVFG